VIPSSIACSTRFSQLVPGVESSYSTTNLSTNADPNVTVRLRSRRTRSGDAAAVFRSNTRKKTFSASRGRPESGMTSAMA
jgi:hypothetical protein